MVVLKMRWNPCVLAAAMSLVFISPATATRQRESAQARATPADTRGIGVRTMDYEEIRTYSELRELAESGDRHAAFALFLRLIRCRSTPGSAEALEGEIRQKEIAWQAMLSSRSGYEGPREFPDKHIRRLRSSLEFCATVPVGIQATEEHLDWLMVALEGGIAEAQFFTTQRPQRSNDPERQEKLAMLRERAFEALDASAQAGDRRALELMGNAYRQELSHNRQSRIRAYAYLMATIDIDLEATPAFQAGFSDAMLNDPSQPHYELKENLDEAELREAEKLRSSVVEAWIRHTHSPD